MNRFTYIDRPNLLEKRPVWLAQTTTVTTTTAPTSVVPSGGTDMVTVALVGGLVFAGLELGGVTHVTKWLGKTLGLSKR